MNDAKQATPAAELERQICSATEPKNEREWWAHREIERLRDRLSVETLALVETLARAEKAEAERDALQAFKDYVHKRLDDAGVSVDPESTHKGAGCRIGGRLDIVLTERNTLRAENERLRKEIGGFLHLADLRACMVAAADENARLKSLLRRYRCETPLGHQPHMIAAEVDAALKEE